MRGGQVGHVVQRQAVLCDRVAQFHGLFQQGDRGRQGVGHGLALAAELRVAADGRTQRAGAVVLVVGLLQQGQGLAVEQVGMRVDAHFQRVRSQWHQGDQQWGQAKHAAHWQAPGGAGY
ncbi:hypothetical protein PPS11_40283 [Pseudomonas putida S11]|nr:hypothetical protein PPS11_40283 [Pseudomonas putida S11]